LTAKEATKPGGSFSWVPGFIRGPLPDRRRLFTTRPKARVGLLLALAATSCAFDDGDPWGVADLSLDVVLAGSQWVRTSEDYEVIVDELVLEVEGVAIEIDDGEAAATSFDPAHPPPGYSNCHGGHCHAEGGGLVPYAEIPGGGGEGGTELRREGAAVSVGAQPTPVALGACSVDNCWLPRGEVHGVSAEVHELELIARVRDTRSPSRLSAPEVMFEGAVPVEAAIEEPVTGHTIGLGEALGLRIAGRLIVPEQLFDGLDLANAPAVISTSSAASQVAENLSRHGHLELVVTRYEP